MTDDTLKRAIADERKLQEAIWIVDDCISSSDSDDGTEVWKILNETVRAANDCRASLLAFLNAIKRANEAVFETSEVDWERRNGL